ncbi:MAG: type II 3-dehydroquinate dehydratase [Omnitrophica WOR_2 bacterium GWF2_38_59]|nr:MAG: type II 3-dehydroquinate dehydratase [Omnitrophica WOR_2 bacterium GWA2_37_7]OGX25205.1 MAG: type II 3-dehydroquinate dehydratase [Omnitrophica WOR_2 bacterium GWF2_38_59]OGX47877.1 MAG: type II 3-dehydroquinate dehydratase [Omnitrophica WOR_2 bacterium RIFOXYA2_FULL_38_17]OGX53555.1 MAG: type II 3-dehydroquinate dehydratase [Omnitrophica WOR_2 bacterium RIFOXYA12_FULL_38_10]OGX56214.1 MAG: type II 3-dehydroquinate dehydratase [Omnitrophica WOR_2 bacterium RIFOXYC2_FULL_38_12]OGX60281.
MSMDKILLIHGPNLNLLGQREKGIYGETTLEEINEKLKSIAKDKNVELLILQSNHEGEIVDIIGQSKKNDIKAILINPAAYTHTSVAIRDAIAAVNIPAVEVHLSNIYSREDFRHTSLIAPVAYGQISGFGVESYVLGLNAIISLIEKQ